MQYRGYGDKLRCPVTSIWGGSGMFCRVLLEVIYWRILYGLEMGLEREFMPPITERRERGYPECMPLTKQLTWIVHTPQQAGSCCAGAKKKKIKQM